MENKEIHHIKIDSEHGGYFITISRYWKGDDGRINRQCRTYHTSIERGRRLAILLLDNAAQVNIQAAKYAVR